MAIHEQAPAQLQPEASKEDRQHPPWKECFLITPVPWKNDPAPAGIVVEQTTSMDFRLHSAIRYLGELTPGISEQHRLVDPTSLPSTDLASVPSALRWFLSRYGPHTPAALIHDRLIGDEKRTEVSRLDADRYFREMLSTLRVPLLRRYLMWAAVVFGSRWKAGWRSRTGLIVWALASATGIVAFILGPTTGNVVLLVAAALAPLLFGALWGRQYPAGVVAAYSAPWILPTTLVVVVGYGIYWVIEKALSKIVPAERKAQHRPTPLTKF